eukprot:3695387-Rhodomonas_salina.2
MHEYSGGAHYNSVVPLQVPVLRAQELGFWGCGKGLWVWGLGFKAYSVGLASRCGPWLLYRCDRGIVCWYGSTLPYVLLCSAGTGTRGPCTLALRVLHVSAEVVARCG